MLVRNKQNQDGFTMVELMVYIAIATIISSAFAIAFTGSIRSYLNLQTSASQFSELAYSTQRVGNVLRGTTDFISVGNNDVTLYAYFYPNSTYVSQVRYYLDPTNTQLLADVTPMTANPPAGTPVTASKKTYTIITKYYKATNTNLFTYLDAYGNTLTLPVSDEHIIKGMTVVLAVPGDGTTANSSKNMTINISLRNRKTNL